MSALAAEQYQALVEHSPAMIWRSGADGKCDYFNATWLSFTGRAWAQEIGDGWLEGVHPNDVDRCHDCFLDSFKQQRAFEREYRLRRFDGTYRCVFDRGEPYFDAAGAFRGFVGNCVDVETPRALETSTAVDDFFEMSLDNVCVAGLDGYFKRLNPSWTRTLGWTVEELMSRPSLEFVHPEDREATSAGRERLRNGLTMGPLTNRYLCKDGGFRWFEWRSAAQPDRGLVYAVARDSTDQKQAEERLRESQELQEKLQRQLVFADRMASVGTLAAGVAHEINNPLAYVTTNIALMLEELENLTANRDSPPLSELLELALEAKAGAERIRKIVRGLKTFSRAEEERRSVLDVVPLLELSVNMMFNEMRHRGRLVKDYGKVPLVEADDARLGQVFINLLVNSAQALPEGDCSANEIRIVTSTDAAGRAVIEAADTGVGIPEQLLERIFDPFFTTKPVGVGTGLGLSICHTIVTSMGGELTVASRVGSGTTFRVVLPAAAPAQVATAAVDSQRPVLACGAVLVVDDEPAIGNVLRRVLRDHEVTTLTSAKEALALLTAGQHFDIIFSDLMMPEMSGMDFYDELSRSLPQVTERVVFVSGGAFTPRAHAFLDRVANERIDKPFNAQGIRDIVQRMLKKACVN